MEFRNHCLAKDVYLAPNGLVPALLIHMCYKWMERWISYTFENEWQGWNIVGNLVWLSFQIKELNTKHVTNGMWSLHLHVL